MATCPICGGSYAELAWCLKRKYPRGQEKKIPICSSCATTIKHMRRNTNEDKKEDRYETT